jgi:hypothetical protein
MRVLEVLVVAAGLILDLGLALWPMWRWLRRGRDPFYVTASDGLRVSCLTRKTDSASATLVLWAQSTRWNSSSTC